jgi:hypothetical protein
MAYSDPTFNSNDYQTFVGTPATPAGLGTTTASGSNSFSGGSQTGNGIWVLPKFFNPTNITNIRVQILTAPAANVTGLTLAFLNGTATIGSALVGTNTAGQTVDATMASTTVDSHGVTTSPAWITTAGVQPTMVTIGTGTASAQAFGTYAVQIQTKDLFTT